MQIELTPEERDLIRRAVETGRVRSPEAAVREALTFWMERERRRDELLAAIDEGDASLAAEDALLITEESVRDLVMDVNRRGRARHAVKTKQIAPDAGATCATSASRPR